MPPEKPLNHRGFLWKYRQFRRSFYPAEPEFSGPEPILKGDIMTEYMIPASLIALVWEIECILKFGFGFPSVCRVSADTFPEAFSGEEVEILFPEWGSSALRDVLIKASVQTRSPMNEHNTGITISTLFFRGKILPDGWWAIEDLQNARVKMQINEETLICEFSLDEIQIRQLLGIDPDTNAQRNYGSSLDAV